MGAMSKSYVLHSGGLDVFRNMREGIDADDITIKYPVAPGYVTPRKAMLMRGETNMMLLSPQQGALQVGWFLLWSVCHEICSVISSVDQLEPDASLGLAGELCIS
jgi:hypothetical protein